MKKWLPRATLLLIIIWGCTAHNPQGNYILAEKLWGDRKYQAAVEEFDKVISKDPKGQLGLQALYRSAMTQTLFLNQHYEAMERFRRYTENSSDAALITEARREMGNILYDKLRKFDDAVKHYEVFLQDYPQDAQSAEILFRVAKSHFFLGRFEKARGVFSDVEKKFPDSPWAERALYEIGVTYYTSGEQEPAGYAPQGNDYKSAMQSYEKFLKKYPQSQWAPHARFGIASCLEEMDQLTAAQEIYESLKGQYPSERVIGIKLTRIQQRIANRTSK